MLTTHNRYRALHKTAGLRANFTLHAIALKYANSLAEMDVFKHSEAPNLGENIAMWGYSDLPDLTNCGGIFFSLIFCVTLLKINCNFKIKFLQKNLLLCGMMKSKLIISLTQMLQLV